MAIFNHKALISRFPRNLCNIQSEKQKLSFYRELIHFTLSGPDRSSLGRHLAGSFAGSPYPSVRLGMHIHGPVACCCHPYCISVSAPFDCEFLTGTLYVLHLLSLVAYCSLRSILGAHVTFSVWGSQGLPWYIPAVVSWASHLTSLSFSILICWKKWMYVDYKRQRW